MLRGTWSQRVLIFKIDLYAVGNDPVERETVDVLRGKRETCWSSTLEGQCLIGGGGPLGFSTIAGGRRNGTGWKGLGGDVLVSQWNFFAGPFFLKVVFFFFSSDIGGKV